MPEDAITTARKGTDAHGHRDSGFVTPSIAISSRTLILVGCLIASLYMLPYAVLWKQARIQIHDNIESNLAVHERLASDGNADFILGGLPPAATASIPPVMLVFHRFLPAFEAYLAWDLILRLIAFLGMFGLLIKIPDQNRILACLVSVAFSWLPFYNVLGLAIAGIPMIALSVIWLTGPNYRNRHQFLGLAIIASFPLVASIAFSPFVAAGMFVAFATQWFLSRKIPWSLTVALVLFAAMTLWVNWPLFETVLGLESITLHRVERVREQLSFDEFHSIVQKSFFSQYHAAALPAPVIWSTIIIALILSLSAIPNSGKRGALAMLTILVISAVLVVPNPDRKFLLIYSLSIGLALSMRAKPPSKQWVAGVFIGVVAILFTASFWLLYDASLLDWLPLGRSFKYSRWYIFLPVVFSGMFFLGLSYIANQGYFGRCLAYGLVILQLVFCIYSADWFRHLGRETNLTWADFVACEVFEQVDEVIDAPKSTYRIACVGFYPSVAHLNGFDTVGGYWAAYPLETKIAMRRVISRELDKLPELKRYFDDWGNRCYVWSSELRAHDIRHMKDPPDKIEDFDIDTVALREMGGDYIFSSLEIENDEALNLRHLGTIKGDPARDRGLSLWIYELESAGE